MAFEIKRRDFLGGMALTIAAGLTPAMQLRAATALHPPSLTGMRGSHPGSFETAHRFGPGGETFALEGDETDPPYDLIVVGAGISGLTAAWFYREAAGPEARILILDNHDDFGGHAKRNEFETPDGHVRVTHGGSESLDSPNANLSEEALYMFDALGIDLSVFEQAFDTKFYSGHAMGEGLFFDAETFGEDVLATGKPALARSKTGESVAGWRAFLEKAPISPEARKQITDLMEHPRDTLIGMSSSEAAEYLQTVSYRDYLTKRCGLSDEAALLFRQETHDEFALGAESVPAYDAMQSGFPGFAGIEIDDEGDLSPDEPDIYHFPDGNASIARLLVRSLIPAAAPGASMADIVTARFDYRALDLVPNRVRLRLNSTVVRVGDAGQGGVKVAYVRDGKQYLVAGKHAILACYNMVVPHILPELPAAQKAALSSNVKAPLVYVSVLLKDWQAFKAAGVHSVHCPGAFYSSVRLEAPVSIGEYAASKEPSAPIVLHLIHVPVDPEDGKSDIDQFRNGRRKLLTMTFDDFEKAARDQLRRMLGPHGFSDDQILAITVNRWPHGYSYYANTLFLPKGAPLEPAPELARRYGNIAIANADSGWNAFAHEAIDQGFRAVGDLLGDE